MRWPELTLILRYPFQAPNSTELADAIAELEASTAALQQVYDASQPSRFSVYSTASNASSSSSDYSSAYATPVSGGVTPACSNPSLTSSSRTSGYGTLPVTPACSTDTLCPPPHLSSSRDTLINGSRDSLVDGNGATIADHDPMDDLPLPPPPPSADYEELPMPSSGGGDGRSDYQQLVVPPSNGDYEQLPVMNGMGSEVLPSEHYDELDTVGALRSELQGAFYRRLSSAFMPHSETPIQENKIQGKSSNFSSRGFI